MMKYSKPSEDKQQTAWNRNTLMASSFGNGNSNNITLPSANSVRIRSAHTTFSGKIVLKKMENRFAAMNIIMNFDNESLGSNGKQGIVKNTTLSFQ